MTSIEAAGFDRHLNRSVRGREGFIDTMFYSKIMCGGVEWKSQRQHQLWLRWAKKIL